MTTIKKKLQSAVRKSKQTRYRIAIDSGVDHAVLRRFMSDERQIKLDTADRLAKYFKLKLR